MGGEPATLEAYEGQVLLIVNTASKCVFTSQYAELEALHDKYGERGFAVLGFPCNQFGGQEPGTTAEIRSFCALTYGVRFPLFGKVEVKGTSAHPLFQYLTSARRGLFGTSAIKWNFTKFLVDREGQVTGRYAPRTRPSAIAPAIERLIT